MITIKTSLGAKMTLDESVIDWKKDDFNARYGVRGEKGNLKYNPTHIFNQVQEVKKQRKAESDAKKKQENAEKEAKVKREKHAEEVYAAHKKANKTEKPESPDKPKADK